MEVNVDEILYESDGTPCSILVPVEEYSLFYSTVANILDTDTKITKKLLEDVINRCAARQIDVTVKDIISLAIKTNPLKLSPSDILKVYKVQQKLKAGGVIQDFPMDNSERDLVCSIVSELKLQTYTPIVTTIARLHNIK